MDSDSPYIRADCLVGRYIDGTVVKTKIISLRSREAFVGSVVLYEGNKWTVLEVRDFYPVDCVRSFQD
jgi:hypothetical protein